MTDVHEFSKQPKDRMAGKKQPITRTVYICNDSDLSEMHQEVDQELDMLKLRMMVENPPAALVAEFDQVKQKELELRKEVRSNSLKFKFRSIGRKKFDKLVEEHPPTEKSKEQLKKMNQPENALNYDPETFSPALVRACLVEPAEFDVEEAFDSDDWNQSELAALYNASMEANATRRVVQLGND